MMKLTVHVDGAGFPNAERLIGDIRRRALARLEAQAAARNRRENARRMIAMNASRAEQAILPASSTIPPLR
jgi:hypothetical protein